MKHRVKIGGLDYDFYGAHYLREMVDKGGKIEKGPDYMGIGLFAIFIWVGGMVMAGSLVVFTGDVMTQFLMLILGGSLVIVSLFFPNVDATYVVWSDEEKTEAEKGLDALFGDD